MSNTYCVALSRYMSRIRAVQAAARWRSQLTVVGCPKEVIGDASSETVAVLRQGGGLPSVVNALTGALPITTVTTVAITTTLSKRHHPARPRHLANPMRLLVCTK